MTNNPTIDGVSRELLRQAYFELDAGTPSIATLAGLRALLDAGISASVEPTNELREHCKQCAEVVKTWPEWKRDCLGGAPAVERQEPAIRSQIQALLDIDARGSLVPHGIGGLARDLLTKSQATIADMRKLLATRVESSRLDEAIDTIARLETRVAVLEQDLSNEMELSEGRKERIAELESGQGEPVAWMHTEIPGMCIAAEVKAHNLKIGGAPARGVEGYNVPLYAAPPAPVSVMLPERMADYDAQKHPAYLHGWNACLEATVALNEVKL